ncbi:tRNA adenosine(34) deaminase TadA [Isobaculum melis]|uniref:tRNA-specific adenosine deaminase n=1 Tax=Isobaculum melis TaxID=142588 RepID=A0A1H9SMU7_9LACT|nr:tRNA adenosine(34) deaminase TadA [Isobaculum melis]SER86306.1 tRNA-adenosine deaminase [Isobaculum melis]
MDEVLLEKEKWMREAMKEAEIAASLGEVPIGAVVVKDHQIIGRGHNLREKTGDATAHAEVIAIRNACETLQGWRLEDAALYVTLEPCPMCSGAMILSRVAHVYYGATDPKGGCAGTLMNLLTDNRFNHQCQVEAGILATECGALLSSFFKELRQKRKQHHKPST